MRKGMLLVIAGLALLVGCGNQGVKSAGVPVDAKWKGAPYRIAFGTQSGKPNPSGITIPPVKYTANPETLETRAILVMRFEASGASGKGLVTSRMIGIPVDTRGPEGTLPADYMEKASKGLSDYLGDRCLQGKVKLSVALARSSLQPQAGDVEVDTKRLSDWLPIDLVYKNPHPKCK